MERVILLLYSVSSYDPVGVSHSLMSLGHDYSGVNPSSASLTPGLLLLAGVAGQVLLHRPHSQGYWGKGLGSKC